MFLPHGMALVLSGEPDHGTYNRTDPAPDHTDQPFRFRSQAGDLYPRWDFLEGRLQRLAPGNGGVHVVGARREGRRLAAISECPAERA